MNSAFLYWFWSLQKISFLSYEHFFKTLKPNADEMLKKRKDCFINVS